MFEPSGSASSSGSAIGTAPASGLTENNVVGHIELLRVSIKYSYQGLDPSASHHVLYITSHWSKFEPLIHPPECWKNQRQ